MAKATEEKLPEEKGAGPTPMDGNECEQQQGQQHQQYSHQQRYDYEYEYGSADESYSSDEFSVSSDEGLGYDCDVNAMHLNVEIENECSKNNKDNEIKSCTKSNNGMRRLSSSALLSQHKSLIVMGDKGDNMSRVNSAPSLLLSKQGVVPEFLANRIRNAELVVGGTNNVGKKIPSLQSSTAVPVQPTDGPATQALDQEDPRVVYSQILVKHGICPNTLKGEELSDFFIEMGEPNVTGYTMEKVSAMRSEDIEALRDMHFKGETLQVCNRFGESIIHSACRRGLASVLRFLVDEASVSLAVKDDYGKTPAHDACWTIKPNFEVVKIVVTTCPDLLLVADKRGSSPLDYTQKSLWSDWCTFLKDNEDILIPKQLRQDIKGAEGKK